MFGGSTQSSYYSNDLYIVDLKNVLMLAYAPFMGSASRVSNML